MPTCLSLYKIITIPTTMGQIKRQQIEAAVGCVSVCAYVCVSGVSFGPRFLIGHCRYYCFSSSYRHNSASFKCF